MSKTIGADSIDEHIKNRFSLKKRVGKGAYGIVWRGVEEKTKKKVAIKKVCDAFRNQIDSQRTFREIMFLRAFRSHPNVVKLFSVHKSTNHGDIYLCMEYMDTDLHNVIRKGVTLRDSHKRFIIYQIINALRYIHSGNVIHRDLKPNNILLDDKCRCKIADFGLSRTIPTAVDNEDIPNNFIMSGYVATRWYRAPECLLGCTSYSLSIDMWGVGCILAEMFLGTPMFPGSSSMNQLQRILAILPEVTDEDVLSMFSLGTAFNTNFLFQNTYKKTFIDKYLEDVPEDGKHLIKNLLTFNPTKRLTAAQAISHQYVARFKNSYPEPLMSKFVELPLNDNNKFSIFEYRNKIYDFINASEKSNGLFTEDSGSQTNLFGDSTNSNRTSTSLSLETLDISEKSTRSTNSNRSKDPLLSKHSNKSIKKSALGSAENNLKISYRNSITNPLKIITEQTSAGLDETVIPSVEKELKVECFQGKPIKYQSTTPLNIGTKDKPTDFDETVIRSVQKQSGMECFQGKPIKYQSTTPLNIGTKDKPTDFDETVIRSVQKQGGIECFQGKPFKYQTATPLYIGTKATQTNFDETVTIPVQKESGVKYFQGKSKKNATATQLKTETKSTNTEFDESVLLPIRKESRKEYLQGKSKKNATGSQLKMGTKSTHTEFDETVLLPVRKESRKDYVQEKSKKKATATPFRITAEITPADFNETVILLAQKDSGMHYFQEILNPNVTATPLKITAEITPADFNETVILLAHKDSGMHYFKEITDLNTITTPMKMRTKSTSTEFDETVILPDEKQSGIEYFQEKSMKYQTSTPFNIGTKGTPIEIDQTVILPVQKELGIKYFQSKRNATAAPLNIGTKGKPTDIDETVTLPVQKESGMDYNNPSISNSRRSSISGSKLTKVFTSRKLNVRPKTVNTQSKFSPSNHVKATCYSFRDNAKNFEVSNKFIAQQMYDGQKNEIADLTFSTVNQQKSVPQNSDVDPVCRPNAQESDQQNTNQPKIVRQIRTTQGLAEVSPKITESFNKPMDLTEYNILMYQNYLKGISKQNPVLSKNDRSIVQNEEQNERTVMKQYLLRD